MKLIVGLGNPGKQYENTRHNIGFDIIEYIAKEYTIPLEKAKFKGIFGTGIISGEKVILLKPLTYMNLSGESIRPLADYYDIALEDIVVIYDDLDLPVGKIRLRQKGSSGGHNGIKSTIAHLGSEKFNRIRVGIDRPKNGMKVTDYVLGKFTKEEQAILETIIKKCSDACGEWTKEPFLQVMNKYNIQ
ncbi:MAG: aminoacyl-tRNA hydrolase [Bacillus sp. (in: firmicutes)]